MQAKLVIENQHFMGRLGERQLLAEISKANKTAIIVVYGRRRVGKTELLEQTYRKRNILKFEGIKGKSQLEQMSHVLWQLSEYVGKSDVAEMPVQHWSQVFKIIFDHIPKGKWTLYFEEIQWLADFKDDFISELKYAWDNYFRQKEGLLLILCGSSPSFIINHVLLSESLYNRSQYEIHLQELSLPEIKAFLGHRSNKEVMDAYLLVGGIPEYLNWVNKASSIFLGLCENTFVPNGFFLNEYKRIFVSSLSENKNYQEIIEFLAREKFSTRAGILKRLKLSSGGGVSEILQDLELCGFIQKYTPYNLKEDSLLSRYCISDAYLQFYYKFIKPIRRDIQNGDFVELPTAALSLESFHKWLGFSFERMCRKNHRIIAKLLGFSGVRYRSGAYFNRKSTDAEPGYQIDLIFDRDDNVLTVCDIKYYQDTVDSRVIEPFEKKLQYLPDRDKKTIQKVLITTIGMEDALSRRSYFDRVILLDDFFRSSR